MPPEQNKTSFLKVFFYQNAHFFVAQILNQTWIACEVWQGEGVEGRLQSGRGAWGGGGGGGGGGHQRRGGGEGRHLGEVSGNRLERGNIAIY